MGARPPLLSLLYSTQSVTASRPHHCLLQTTARRGRYNFEWRELQPVSGGVATMDNEHGDRGAALLRATNGAAGFCYMLQPTGSTTSCDGSGRDNFLLEPVSQDVAMVSCARRVVISGVSGGEHDSEL